METGKRNSDFPERERAQGTGDALSLCQAEDVRGRRRGQTSAGSGMRRRGELGAPGCPYLSILTSSWAPGKDKAFGVSAGSTRPTLRPRPTVFWCLTHLQFLLSLCIPPSLTLFSPLLCSFSSSLPSPCPLPSFLPGSKEREETFLQGWGEVRCSCSFWPHSWPGAPTCGTILELCKHHLPLGCPSLGVPSAPLPQQIPQPMSLVKLKLRCLNFGTNCAKEKCCVGINQPMIPERQTPQDFGCPLV